MTRRYAPPPGRIGTARALALAATVALAPTRAQVRFQAHTRPSHVDLVSPWKGPGSAQIIPAALSETRKAHGHLGFTAFPGSDGLHTVYQFAADLPVGFSAGLGG